MICRAIHASPQLDIMELASSLSQMANRTWFRFQARAFVLLPMATQVAVIVGLLVAGVLAEFGSSAKADSFLGRHPYALPALMNAGFLFLALLAAFFFLEEAAQSVFITP